MKMHKLPRYGKKQARLTHADWLKGAIYGPETVVYFVPEAGQQIREDSKSIIEQRANEEYNTLVESFNDRVHRAHSFEEILRHQWGYHRKMIEYPFTEKDVDASTGYIRGKEYENYPSWEELKKLRQFYWQYTEGDVQFYFNDYPVWVNGKWHTLKADAIAIRRYFDFLEQQRSKYLKDGLEGLLNKLPVTTTDEQNPTPLSHAQISLIRIYEQSPITKINSQRVAAEYGRTTPNAGRVLLKTYNGLDNERHRLLRRDIENDIEVIKKSLSESALEKAERELVSVRNKRR